MNINKKLNNNVINQFEEQCHEYSKSVLRPETQIINFIDNWIENHFDKISEENPVKICEFGGGGGVLLNEIYKRQSKRVVLCNAELVEKYRYNQKSEEIEFIQTSILNSQFSDDSYDIVIIRNVLHHLIGNSIKQTSENQSFAIRELFRIIKPRGLVLIEEQVNQSLIACKLLYYFSKVASRFRLRINSFQITPYTIV